jgi:Glycosyl transferase family 2/Galactosyltransferase
MPFYSLLVTSMDRDDLLERTIRSYMKMADIPPREIIICDNGPKRDMPTFLQRYRHLGLRWINEGGNRGQIYSCDRLWHESKYDYACWLEEDWLFTQGDFVQKSFEILDRHPEVVAVTLRGDWNHPLVSDPRFPGIQIAQPGWKGGWGGFCFNPGLRRKSDYQRIGTYGKHVGYGTAGLGHEMELSKLYASLGYVLAALPDRCVHIGGGRSRAANPTDLVSPPKILIAVPACHRLDYGPWESEDSPSFDKKKAWQGRPYGTDIHISGENPRIEAVRNSWFKDVANHSNLTAKFFYGHGDSDLLDDEVRLRVPDDYAHLPQKTIAICEWASAHSFDYVMKCDDDTYVWVDRLMIEIMSRPFDFAGHINGNTSCSGGCGYILSKRAMEEVIRNPISAHWAEDITVGMIMKSANIPPLNLPNHRSGDEHHWFNIEKIPEGTVTIHAVRPEDLIKIHERQ